MSPEGLQIFAVVFAVWGVAVAIKAFHCLRTGNDYVFSMWDGGMIRAGKRLNKMGKQIKLVVGVLEAVGCIGLLGGFMPLMTAAYFIIFVAVLSLVSDFVTAQ